MRATEIVSRLLEADPDDVNPKHELLRNDPAHDLKELVKVLQNVSAFTVGYSRLAGLAKLVIKVHTWSTEILMAQWLVDYLNETGFPVVEDEILVTALGSRHGSAQRHDQPEQSKLFTVMFPSDGPTVQWTSLV